jgi:hypothetical protein
MKKKNLKDIIKIYESYDNFIDSKSEKFLHHDYFHSHVTFSRNHLVGSEILINYIKDKFPKKKIFHFLKKTFVFYIKNISNFLFWIIYFIYSKSFYKKNLQNLKENKIFIQTFLNYKSYKSRNLIKDNYFKEVYSYLENTKQDYFIIANIFEPLKNFQNTIKLINNFKNSKKPILTEFDCLGIIDLFRILKFIFYFPWITYIFKFKLKSSSHLDKLFNYDYINSLSHATFLTYVQFLFAKRLGKIIGHKKTKIISWNENQLIHRNFIRGIKSKNITIYGCQYFLKYPTCRWMYLRDSDQKYSVIPDKILVCGPEYIPSKSQLNYAIGSPFRYRNVFKNTSVNEVSDDILVILPYEKKETTNVIDFLQKSKLSKKYNIHLKIHPNFPEEKKFYKKLTFDSWTIIDKYEDIAEYKLVITKSSGSILEYIAQGCSVIIIDDSNPLTLNPLTSKIGEGINYDYIKNPNQLTAKIDFIFESRRKNPEKFLENSNELKLKFFSKISEESLKKDFDI